MTLKNCYAAAAHALGPSIAEGLYPAGAAQPAEPLIGAERGSAQ